MAEGHLIRGRDEEVDCVWNVMAQAQKPDFVFRRNGRVHLNWPGGAGQFSRLLAFKVCASAVVMLDTPCSEIVWKILTTHSIRQFPLHFSSRASPCAITFQLDPENSLWLVSADCTLRFWVLALFGQVRSMAAGTRADTELVSCILSYSAETDLRVRKTSQKTTNLPSVRNREAVAGLTFRHGASSI